ncbi:MAG TPA: hypothetical protein VGM84_19940 [Steroidobacteraceae bacterium]|jgi:hypothetical protein
MNARLPSDDVQELWQMQPGHAPQIGLDEVRGVARLAGRKLLWMNALAYLGTAITMAAFAFYIWHFKEVGVKVGSVGVILALLYVLFQHRKWVSPGALLEDVGSTGSVVTLLREFERIAYYNNHSWRLWRAPLYASIVFFLLAISFESWALAMAPWSWVLHGCVALVVLGLTLRQARSHARHIKPFNDGIEALRNLLEHRAE